MSAATAVVALIVVIALAVVGCVGMSVWEDHIKPRWRRHHPAKIPAADRPIGPEVAEDMQAWFDMPSVVPAHERGEVPDA